MAESQKIPQGATVRPITEDIRFQSVLFGDLFALSGNNGLLDTTSYHAYTGDADQRLMIERDPEVRSAMQRRKSAVTGLTYDVIVDDGAPEGLREECIQMLAGIPGFQDFVRSMLDAVLWGFKVGEAKWDYVDGKLTPIKMLARPNSWFTFKPDGTLCIYDGTRAIPLDEQGEYRGVYYVLSHDAADGNRRGRGLATNLWYPVWASAENFKFWLIHNDKYAMPIVDAQVSGTETKKQAVLALIKRAVNQGAIVHGEEVKISFLAANNRNSTDAFGELIRVMEARIAKLITGQNMTSGGMAETGSGSYAMGKVGADVEHGIAEADGIYVADLMTWIVRNYAALNYSEEVARLIRCIQDKDAADLSARDRSLIIQSLAFGGVQVETSMADFRRTFALPAPTGPEDILIIGNQAAPPQDFAGVRGGGQFSASPTPEDKTMPAWMTARAEAQARAAQPDAEDVFGQMTPILEAGRSNPKSAGKAVAKFAIKDSPAVRRMIKRETAAIFSALAIGMAAPAARAEAHRAFASTPIDPEYAALQKSGLLEMDYLITPQGALDFVRKSGLVDAQRLSGFTDLTGRWATTSVYLTDNAARETVRTLLASQLGADSVTDIDDFGDALGRVDYDAFMKSWEEVGLPNLTSAQTRLIFDQNTATALHAGRWDGMQNPTQKEIVKGLKYISMLLPTTRPEHSAWHNSIHPMNSTFWDRWYPPNGFNCKCSVIPVYEWEAEGKQVTDGKYKKFFKRDPGGTIPSFKTATGITYNFNYNPGKLLAAGNADGLAF